MSSDSSAVALARESRARVLEEQPEQTRTGALAELAEIEQRQREEDERSQRYVTLTGELQEADAIIAYRQSGAQKKLDDATATYHERIAAVVPTLTVAIAALELAVEARRELDARTRFAEARGLNVVPVPRLYVQPPEGWREFLRRWQTTVQRGFDF